MDEGDVSIEQDGTTYTGHWRLEKGILSLYVGDYGPMSTHLGSLPPNTLARQLLSEFLNGAKSRTPK